MTAVESAESTTGTGRSPLKGWLAVSAVTLGIFSLMTSELLPVGLLTPVGSELNVSEGTAGLMVTVPGLVAAASAPLITVGAGRVDRRIVLAVLIGLVGAANLASAFTPNFAALLVARVLIGVSVGGFWAIAGGLAVRLVPEKHVPRAMSVIFGGVSTASVLGVPTGTLLGDLSGWRTAFGAVGVLGLVALVCLVLMVPALPATRTITLPELPRLLRDNAAIRIGVIATFLLITGHFIAYTFVRPVLQDISGFDGNMISSLLLLYGVAGIVGNFVAGSRAATHVRRTLLVIAVVLTAAMVLIPVLGTGRIGGVILLVVWGLGYGGVSVSLQTWMLKAAPEAGEAASSLFVLMFNLSIALGALIGGRVVDGSTAGVLWLGGALVILTAVAVAASRKSQLA
ncbi:MFS transporter [Streptomyces sp. SID10853]|uniref:MFS transporter n=1 Tax=Streptomyces sp. SID10853 TaxID=2706028 RepID=UPI0013C1F7A7|nr:MFS transporter [Streptomyces sp. SID10853]NDZ80050.1 MFS transporter [Streptomyces sp. SID10853]